MLGLAIVATCMTIPMLIAMPFVKDVLLDDNNDQEVKPGRGRPRSVDTYEDETKKELDGQDDSDKEIFERETPSGSVANDGIVALPSASK